MKQNADAESESKNNAVDGRRYRIITTLFPVIYRGNFIIVIRFVSKRLC